MTEPEAQTDPEGPKPADASEPTDGQMVPTDRPDGLGARLGTGLVRFYQNAISPMFPPSCRFQPTCSEYTRIAIARYGLIKGSYLGIKRLLKCHPFHPGGHDPVP